MRLGFEAVGKRFSTLRGSVQALRDVNLAIDDGEFFVILGPSGCGKSTLLNLAAGLERPSSGLIRFDDRVAAAPVQGIFLSPRQRNVAMVFQSYALYPHLRVFDNIAFPLRIAKAKEADVRLAVAEAAEKLGIQELLDRAPGELSGGQRQRVAIARAIVRRPSLFLLDEPLSNLDAQLRSRTRVELKQLQRELNITTLYVTHDQTEAMTLGDRIGLFKDGALIQVGTPDEMYAHPRTSFVASFIGSPPMNLLRGKLEDREGKSAVRVLGKSFMPPRRFLTDLEKGTVLVGIRPEHIRLCHESEDNAVAGRITTLESLGREDLLHIDCERQSVAVLTSETGLRAGDLARICFDPEKIHVFQD